MVHRSLGRNVASRSTDTRSAARGTAGVAFALVAAFAFAASGILAKPLMAAGWSPLATVLARLLIAGLVLLLPMLWQLRFDLRPLWRHRWLILVYGGFAVAIGQTLYFMAVERIPVSTALLIQYLAPVALVGVAWLVSRRAPGWLVLAGSALAVAGLVLVIGPGGTAPDPLGLCFAFLSMAGLACHYWIGGHQGRQVHPLVLTGAGFLVGAVILALIALTGVLPVTVAFVDVPTFGLLLPWWVPLLSVALVSSVLAFQASLAALRRLGTRTASFLGLLEVVLTGVLGWLVLGEAMSALQILGGALIVGGIVLIRLVPEAGAPAGAPGRPETAE